MALFHSIEGREGETPVPGLSLWPTSACLATELADELERLARAQSASATGDDAPLGDLSGIEIVLPTKRLGTWLTALLAERLGALVPPRLATFDEFVSRHCEALGLCTELRRRDALSDPEQELILLSLIKEGGYRHLVSGHEHEIKQFFSELWDWSVGAEAFPRLIEALERDLGFSDVTLTTLHERTAELRSLYERYLACLEERGLVAPSYAAAQRSAALAEALNARATLESRWIYFAGFTSLAGAHDPLLAALARQANLSFWINEPPDIYSRKNPLSILREAIGGDATVRRPRAGATARPAGQHLRIHQSEDALGEVARAFELVRSYTKAGCPPSLIAILVTDDKTYGKPLRYFARKLGIDCNLAVTTPLVQTLAGRFLAGLMRFIAEPEDPAKLLGFLSHPYAIEHWRQAVPEFADDTDATLRARLATTICAQDPLDFPNLQAVRGGMLSAFAHVTLQGEHGKALTAYCMHMEHRLEAFIKGSKEGQPLSSWHEVFTVLVRSFALATGTETAAEADVGVKASVKERLAAFARLLTRLSTHLGGQCFRAREFLAVMREHLLAGDVRSVGEPLKGLQILSVAEARYVPFEVAIVLGCHEGTFPRSLPRDILVDNYLKSLIGLPGWQLLEAIEDTTFQLLKARLANLHLLYPTRTGKEPAVRSRFLEPLIFEDRDRYVSETAAAGLEQLIDRREASQRRVTLLAEDHHGPAPVDAAIGLAPQLERGGLFDPRLQQQSASSLELLINCPYRFLLNRLGVKELRLPDPDEPQSEGDWLHEVVEAFFTGKARGERHEPTLTARDLPPPNAFDFVKQEFVSWAVDRLCRLTEKLGPRGVTDSPLYLQLRHHSWPALAQHVLRLASVGLRADGRWKREHRFGYKAGARSRTYLEGVELRGSIDSVDELAHGFVMVTDYKRKSTPSRHEVIKGISPQLPIYAVALADQQADRTTGNPVSKVVLGYYSLLGGKWEGVAAGSEALEAAREAGLVPKRAKDTAEDLAARVNELWAWRKARITAGGDAKLPPYRPDPSRCGLCHLQGVCRKQDPRYAAHFETWDELARRLAAEVDAGRDVSGSDA